MYIYIERGRQTDIEKEGIRVTLYRGTVLPPKAIGYQTKSPMPGVGYTIGYCHCSRLPTKT